jgi:hypothetical protein
VCAAITALSGVTQVAYDAREDRFSVRFDARLAKLADIFAAVYLAGRQQGREYLPAIISEPKK